MADQQAILKTNRGDITINLFPDHAPETVANFTGLAEGTKSYDAGNGQTGPPTFAGSSGNLAEALGSSQMPWERHLDLRVHKGFAVANTRMRVFADIRNPLDLENTNQIFLETGTSINDDYRESIITGLLQDQTLDGDNADIDDFNIATEFEGNELNRYSLMKAEERFGDGDGIFTVEEQRRAYGAFYDLFNGEQFFIDSNQSLRLGVVVVF